MNPMTFMQFAKAYCIRQQQTPAGLLDRLLVQKARYNPTGWMLLECQMMDSHHHGSLTILPYGGTATYKEVPTHPISPRGLASDMSVVIATLAASEI